MDSSKRRFFIALLPPQEIQDYANEVKQIFVDRFNSRAALKSPPHVTLQPPFEWANAELLQLSDSLGQFARSRSPVPMTLAGFGAFVPRVVYINVLRTADLLEVQAALLAHTEATLGIVDAVAKTRPFAPHMTVGFRDLTKANFRTAWAEFQHQSYDAAFTIDRLTLLIHTGQRWIVDQEFAFEG
ncbi:2'-5' RNA ligase family protein [Leptolyngbya sp. FACHB-36]|uniref:2'-5' RNA ligase family protein n=1 Tax=Leptolyngbya sp. FACHB-36 TaxID=2692808 RepID=UPI001680246F|nr:2'-5' RNA ligase family protein [Leptolyngbya sp. FACHB-36]MBD2019748.1 2'-5' RNA ligase family protein [Leptolyngbya sp. FACHB-36]